MENLEEIQLWATMISQIEIKIWVAEAGEGQDDGSRWGVKELTGWYWTHYPHRY